jgi:hypothetical protein
MGEALHLPGAIFAATCVALTAYLAFTVRRRKQSRARHNPDYVDADGGGTAGSWEGHSSFNDRTSNHDADSDNQ